MNEKHDFYMPAEWQTHERTIIEWPVKTSMCYPENHIQVLEVFTSIIKAIAEYELVTIIVNEESKRELLAYIEGIADMTDILVIPHNDSWARDNGPTFIISDHHDIMGINWRFNAWGEKYLPYDLDDDVAPILLELLKIPIVSVPLVLEGGSIHVDGEGTLLSTKECLLNHNRNPELSAQAIETILKERLNVSTIIWLNKGLYGDETDGHIDNIACFVKPGTVMIQTCHNPNDPNFDITKENLEILHHAIDARGRKLEIIEMPSPPVRYYKNKRLTLSYMNYYFVNGAIILPVFGEDAIETDIQAEAILKSTFPDRDIVTVPSIELIKEGGNIHCITQQMPRKTTHSLIYEHQK
ncbi:MAG: agmatine deiminase family protein [Vallitaleaceae bacterium]|jgi:agmatine deiminase|nr:agmatine deiminase family protein [Vallitaleaceae bacterium]